MRNVWVSILMAAILAGVAWAIPAADIFFSVTQQDGSIIEIRKRGNEHFHFTETRNGKIIGVDTKTHFETEDSQQASPIFLAKGPSHSSDPVSTKDNTGEKNVLVVLVQFNDTKFSTQDPNADVSRILSEEGYNVDNSVGSAADYFKDNSTGKFSPKFDVLGPVTVSGNNYTTYGPYSKNGDYGAQTALAEALTILKNSGSVDLKKYDNNNDGYLDYVHMIYAGFGSHDSDQDSAIWPHRWVYKTLYNFGSWRSPLYVAEYACNAELDGLYSSKYPGEKKLFGVGNFIHEFSHLLGLPDLYSTQVLDSLNEPFTPSTWDIMDMGSYNTSNPYGPLGTSPPYYSTYEKMTLGWMTPADLKNDIADTLKGVQHNDARILSDPANKNEFFILEYRDGTKWDKMLPNHGMLIWHIDYQKTIWNTAAINNTEHQHVDIIEADNIGNLQTLSGDVFPGTSKKTFFNKFFTWSDKYLGSSIKKISEASDYSYIAFETTSDTAVSDIADDPIAEESSSSTNEINSSSSSESAIADSTGTEDSDTTKTIKDTTVVPEQTNYFVQNSLHPRISLTHNEIQISNLCDGIKDIRIFALTGKQVYAISTTDNHFSIERPRQRVPYLLYVTKGNQILLTKRIQ